MLETTPERSGEDTGARAGHLVAVEAMPKRSPAQPSLTSKGSFHPCQHSPSNGPSAMLLSCHTYQHESTCRAARSSSSSDETSRLPQALARQHQAVHVHLPARAACWCHEHCGTCGHQCLGCVPAFATTQSPQLCFKQVCLNHLNRCWLVKSSCLLDPQTQHSTAEHCIKAVRIYRHCCRTVSGRRGGSRSSLGGRPLLAFECGAAAMQGVLVLNALRCQATQGGRTKK